MPSNRIIKRTALSTKYNFDIWGFSTGNSKFLGLINRLYLSPRFMLEVLNELSVFRMDPVIFRTPFSHRFTQWYWLYWKRRTKDVLAFQDPFPAYDRPKNMTQVLKKRSMQNLVMLKNLRLKLYAGFKKEYQYRNYIALARRIVGISHTEAVTRILDCRLVHLLLRAGFAKNVEIALDLVKHGYVRVGEIINFNPNYIVPVTKNVHVVLPSYIANSRLANALFRPYQKISIPAYFLINWKLMSIRFVQIPRARQFTHPHFNLNPNDVSFLYAAVS